MAFLLAGGVSSIPMAIAVWALARPQVFLAYLGFAITGACLLGFSFGLLGLRQSEPVDGNHGFPVIFASNCFLETLLSMNQRSIWYLAIAETLVWAGMFYSFPALILQWENDLGWSKTEISATFTTALIVSALMAPLAGRLIDLGYGRIVLNGSAFFGGLAVASLSWVESYWTFFGPVSYTHLTLPTTPYV